MRSYLRCLLHLRSFPLRGAHAVKPPIHRSSPPRVSFAYSVVFHRRIGSFLEPAEEDEQTKQKRSVSAYYDPVQGRVVTGDQRADDVFRSSNQIESSNRLFGEEESGRGIWVKQSKQKGEEENTEKLRFSSSYARKKTKSGKVKVTYECDSCGTELSQWWGVCPKCGVGSVVERAHNISEVNPKRGAEVSQAAVRSWLPQKACSAVPKTLSAINMGRDQSEWRIPL